MSVNTDMGYEDITVTRETYEKLRAHRRADESVSDVIARLTSSRTRPVDSEGAYPGLGHAVGAARDEFEADAGPD